MKFFFIKSNRFVLTAIYYFAFIGLGLTSASFGPTLQGLADNTSTTLAQISTLFLVRSFGYLTGTLIGGRVYDRHKGHPILGGVLVAMIVCLFLIPIMQSIFLLAVILILLGTGEGLLDVGSNTLLFWTHGDRIAPFMNGLHAFWGVGTTIAPLIVAWVLFQTGSIQWSYWLLGIIILPAALTIFILESPNREIQKTHSDEVKADIKAFLPSGVMLFLYVGAELGLGGWIYTYAVQSAGAAPTVAAGINSAFWLGFTLSRLLSIPLAAKFKPITILWLDLIGTLLCLVAITLFPGQQRLLWAGSVGIGVFMASIFPTILNEAQTRIKMTGNVTSWFFVSASIGGMLLPFLIGQIIAPYGPASVIVAVLAAMVGCTLVFGLGQFTKRRSPTLSSKPDPKPHE